MLKRLEINKIITKKRMEKLSMGVNVVNHMKSEINKDATTSGFILDFTGMQYCSTVVFKQIIADMQTRFNGQYQLQVEGANQLIAESFKAAFRK